MPTADGEKISGHTPYFVLRASKVAAPFSPIFGQSKIGEKGKTNYLQ